MLARYLTLPVLSLLTVLSLAGCRAEPGVAAYVGDRTITTDQLSAAIQDRMADPNIAAVIEPGDPDYQRFVLSLLIKGVGYRLLSDTYDVAVTDRDVEVRLDELLSGDSADEIDALYARLAAEERVAEIDVRENVRQALIREQIAVEEELDAPIQDPALRQRYAELKDQLSTIELGVITVPDQETAEATLEALVADPSAYVALAAPYAGPTTYPSVTSSAVSEVPPELLPSVLQTAVGQGFTVAVPGISGIVVGYVASLEVPTFEAAREQILAEAASGVDAAAGEIVNEFLSGLDIDVNPRYGSLDQGRVVPGSDDGVVQILEDRGTI
ncbi:MAG: hypothetical protein M3313_09545 [Actinomycetota bacterium]|nr:hypothetical protein [Actinomycetota bacterium]